MPVARKTIAHAITAIEEALTTAIVDAARPRALAAAELFSLGLPRGLPVDIRSRDAFNAPTRKTCFVGIANTDSVDGEPGTELGSDHLFRMQLFISRDYWLGYEGTAYYPTSSAVAEVKATFVRETDDFMRICAALCWPGALARTAAGEDTGLAGHAAVRFQARSELQVETAGAPTNHRLLNARDLFIVQFQFDPTP